MLRLYHSYKSDKEKTLIFSTLNTFADGHPVITFQVIPSLPVKNIL